MLSQNYDSKNDILYLAFGNKRESIGDEVIDGYVVMRDFFTNEVTGLTIFDFMSKYHANKLPAYQLPVDVDYQGVMAHITNHALVETAEFLPYKYSV